MPIRNDTIAARLAKQAAARERTAKLAAQQRQATARRKLAAANQAAAEPTSAPVEPPAPPPLPQWRLVKCGDSRLNLFARGQATPVGLEPLTRALVDRHLEAARSGNVFLALVWPAKLDAVPLIHALATLERSFQTDFRGLRTVMYPATHATRSALHSVLASRQQLSQLLRRTWSTRDGVVRSECATESPAFSAALAVLNHIELWQQSAEVPQPALAELVPTFIYSDASQGWRPCGSAALERTVRKVEKLQFRQSVRTQLSSAWGSPQKAPGALMLMHYGMRRTEWKDALQHPAFKGHGAPEVMLFDATEAAAKTSYQAVRRIPEVLKLAREVVPAICGAVIVTDDPRTFLSMRAVLRGQGIRVHDECWAAEATDGMLSTRPKPADWVPLERSLSNFAVSIVDRDASQVALSLQRLANACGSEESTQHQALMEACLYVLRLSNLPAGFTDLLEYSAQAEEHDFSLRSTAWSTHELRLRELLASGGFGRHREEVERALGRVHKLIDAWREGTPMAMRLLSELRKLLQDGKSTVVAVLSSRRYIELAERFLERKMGDEWRAARQRVEWHTLRSVDKLLCAERKRTRFIFLGLNNDVLRVLLTHPDIPHGTGVFVAYKHASTALQVLKDMKPFDAFKAYRGRIGLLSGELERRLAEVPSPVDVSKLIEASLVMPLEPVAKAGTEEPPQSWVFELEGGLRAHSSGYVYRYVPDEDPAFKRANAKSVEPGDFIFEMDEELRTSLEQVLNLADGASGVVSPFRMLMRLYRQDIQARCGLHFTGLEGRKLAQAIHDKMVNLDKVARDCRIERVQYWLDVNDESDERPHAARRPEFFKLFCSALGLGPEDTQRYWGYVRSTRSFNQNLGRELAARYAEIIFQPESAIVYRQVSPAAIEQLQREAVRCVRRVERVHAPAASSRRPAAA